MKKPLLALFSSALISLTMVTGITYASDDATTTLTVTETPMMSQVLETALPESTPVQEPMMSQSSEQERQSTESNEQSSKQNNDHQDNDDNDDDDNNHQDNDDNDDEDDKDHHDNDDNEDENVILEVVGQKPTFDFEPKEHWDLTNGWIDFERGVK